MQRVVQHAKLVVVQRQIIEYTCDTCGRVCGTRENPKETWMTSNNRKDDKHYCKRTCLPTLLARRGRGEVK